MIKMVRLFSLIACLVLLLPALFACRSTQPPAPTPSPKPAPTTAAPKPTSAVKPAPVPSPSPTVAAKPSPKPAAKPILVGITEDTSGFSRDAGTASMEGAILAIEEWNAKGGVRGSKVEYVTRDNAGDPAKAATIAREFVQMGAVAVIGGTSSTVAIPESKAFLQAKIPFMTGSAAMEIFEKAPADGKIYGFTASGTNDLMVESVLRDMGKQGFKKFAILISNVAWPKDLSAITKQFIAKKYGQQGMEIVGEIVLDVNATDVAAEVMKLKNLKFDAVFSSMYPGNAYAYARALATIGWRPPPRTYVLWALTQSTWRIHEKSLFANMRMYDLYNPAKTAAVKKRGEFMIRWQHEPVSEGHWVMAYDNANVLMTAINAAGPDPVAIRDWLETKAKGLPIIAGAVDSKADFSMDTLHSLSDVDHLYFFADLNDKGEVVYK